jgi:DNA-binding response OmpR family regulator
MDSAPERISIVEADPQDRDALLAILRTAGYDPFGFAAPREALESLHEHGADILVLGTIVPNPVDPVSSGVREALATVRGSAATQGIRIILLVGPEARHRAEGLELGADDAISRPWDAEEFLARVRVQLQVRRANNGMLEKVNLAEEGQHVAATAFDALAVTEKMASDASSLERDLKIGLVTFFGVAAVMAALYILFLRSAQKQTQRSNIVIARLEGRLLRQQDVFAQVHKLRQQQGANSPAAGTSAENPDDLHQHAAELKTRMANAADSNEVAALKQDLDETNKRLSQIEQLGNSAETLIRADVNSVCLLHVSVAFRNQQNGLRLRYAGLNQQGDPLQDSQGNPILTLDGNGPEVKVDVFGTGFLVDPGGKLITNRHVAEPWWKNDDLAEITSQGFQAEISAIHAYFPGDPRAFTAEIKDISHDADLASIQVDMRDLKRIPLAIDPAEGGAVNGEPIVLMGYATGLAAILARTDEDTAHNILTSDGGDVSGVLDELAKRNLIRPTITQGHIGDVLPDKIVFDAQTTSGGSGGPLFNREGKVIGVTYAVLQGFGGSNLGIPIKYSKPLLASQSGPN